MSSTALSVCKLAAADVVPGVAMTTRSARLLPNTNSDWADVESVVWGTSTTVVLVTTADYTHIYIQQTSETIYFLSLLQAVNPSGEGSATRVLLLQSSRSSTSTGVRFRLMRSCHEMVFIHLSLCLPWFRCPYITSASRIVGYAWCSGHLLITGHVRTISVLTHVFCL